MIIGFRAAVGRLPELFWSIEVRPVCPSCGADAELTVLPDAGGAGLFCPACNYHERFAGAGAGAVGAAVLRDAAARSEAGTATAGAGAARTAFAGRLRRESPRPEDEVALVFLLVDGAGNHPPPVFRAVEALVTLPAGREAEARELYQEALERAVDAAVRDLPAGWTVVDEYPDVPVKIEGVALSVRKGG